MSYGQSLSEAELQGAAGAGSFKFIEYDEATETITEIGSRKPDQVRSLSVRTVSYTHLDVYKRQVYILSMPRTLSM